MTVTRSSPFVAPTHVAPRGEANPTPGVVDAPPTSNPLPSPSDPSFGDINWEMLKAVFNINININQFNLSPTQCMHPPKGPEQGCAPPGQGLKKEPDGTITTAGGYKIRALGDKSAWTITGPDGKELTRVWGDPHVKEGDGTKWDFTKSSNFTLPDGTRIGCKTTSETGKSVSAALDIANGNDRVQISGVNSKSPQVGEVGPGGVQAWQAANGNRDTFDLRGDGSKQDWVKYRADGQLDGVVTGATLKNGGYQQKTTGQDSTLARGGGPTVGPGDVLSHPLSGGFGGLERLFGLGGLDRLFGLSGLGGLNGLGGMGGLEQLLAFGGFGGMGQLGALGQSPYAAFQAFAAMQSMMSMNMSASAQLGYMRYNHSFR